MNDNIKQKNSINELASAIRVRRKYLRLTQEELANLSNTSKNFVCQVESGKSTIQLNKLLDILKTLGLQIHIINGNSIVSFSDDIQH